MMFSRGFSPGRCFPLKSHVFILRSNHTRFIHSRKKSPGGPISLYENLLRDGTLSPDDFQKSVVNDVLQPMWVTLNDYKPHCLWKPPDKSKGSFLSQLFSSGQQDEGKKNPTAPQGVYLFGDVGTGKTMLMDLLYEAIKTENKRRVHFHAFMLDVHARVHQMKSKNPKMDVSGPLADELLSDAWLLCFDEFQVTDIADAMILRRLLGEMFDRGMVLFTTSNRHPTELYRNGIQRESFIPCIDMLQERCKVISLNSGIDYRKRAKESMYRAHISPLNESSSHHINLVFDSLLKGKKPESKKIDFWGRTLYVERQCDQSRVARFTFEQLCGRPASAMDYLEIIKHYDTIIVEDVPQLNLAQRNEARRFITLIDTLYENKVKLFMSSEPDLHNLFSAKWPDEMDDSNEERSGKQKKNDSNRAGEEEIFAFHRCISRLVQMQSRQWLGEDHVSIIDKLDQEKNKEK